MNPNHDIIQCEAIDLLSRIASMNTLYALCARNYLNDKENAIQFILDTAQGITEGGFKGLDEDLSHDIVVFAWRNENQN